LLQHRFLEVKDKYSNTFFNNTADFYGNNFGSFPRKLKFDENKIIIYNNLTERLEIKDFQSGGILNL
jgi:hypothetical protein